VIEQDASRRLPAQTSVETPFQMQLPCSFFANTVIRKIGM
jgi:hypothetical protein